MENNQADFGTGANAGKEIKQRCEIKSPRGGTSLVVQWLRFRAPNAGALGSIPGQGTTTRSHMLQLRVGMPKQKIPHAASKTQLSQINN